MTSFSGSEGPLRALRVTHSSAGSQSVPRASLRDVQHGWASKCIQILSSSERECWLGTTEALEQGTAPFLAQAAIRSWPWFPPQPWLLWSGHQQGQEKPVKATSPASHRSTEPRAAQNMVVFPTAVYSPLPSCCFIVSPTCPFPPVKSHLCKPLCLNPCTCLQRHCLFARAPAEVCSFLSFCMGGLGKCHSSDFHRTTWKLNQSFLLPKREETLQTPILLKS